MNEYNKKLVMYGIPQAIFLTLFIVFSIIRNNNQLLYVEVYLPVSLRYITFAIFLLISIAESIMMIREKHQSLGATVLVLAALFFGGTTIYQINNDREVYYYEEDGMTVIVVEETNVLMKYHTFYYQKNSLIFEKFAHEENLIITSYEYHIEDGYLIITYYTDGSTETVEYLIP